MGFYDTIYSLLKDFFFSDAVITGTWKEQIIMLTTMFIGIFLLFTLFKFILSTIFFWKK